MFLTKVSNKLTCAIGNNRMLHIYIGAAATVQSVFATIKRGVQPKRLTVSGTTKTNTCLNILLFEETVASNGPGITRNKLMGGLHSQEKPPELEDKSRLDTVAPRGESVLLG